MSLLVATPYPPGSYQHKDLLSILARIQNENPSLRKTLVAHVLHLDRITENRPNAFLNLARLLSPCPRTVLFPGNLSYTPPKNLYKTLVGQQAFSSSAVAGRMHKRKPVVFTMREYASFPFAPLAPVLVSRDDSTWCTERFFANVSRSVDWEECLWQVWLAHFGDVEVKQLQGWAPALPDSTSSTSSWQSENPVMEKIHRRLAAKFRGETCALAIRRFTALRNLSNNADTKKARWLKRVCRGWSSG
ncbi:hypothetical protein GSI_03880 [Ganoderma sinense ZZ0214-1]|uniref:Uncharacterized protein n=1 Tax=Ganoderma sinense ZZ0214-1 TaxID=1077348 RepID=A0A2G8SK75_9APHY|nr:hypothetical protein GSI_03880 [Ganoderma sinense ZZ0214-1]